MNTTQQIISYIDWVVQLTIVPKGETFLPNYTVKKLTDLYHRKIDAKAKIRLLAAIFRKEGKTYDEIGMTLKYPLTTIRDWLMLST